MKRWAAFLGSLALFGVLLVQLIPVQESEAGPLLVYCAAGIRPPVEQLQAAFGGKVQMQYGGSQTLLANLQASRTGDLYIPADDTYLELLRAQGLLREVLPLAEVRPVLAVRKGNPLQVRSLADLRRPELKLSLPLPEAAAAGKLVKEALLKSGHWKDLEKAARVTKTTVNEVANDLKLGAADAGFVWDATVRQYPELEAVDLPELASSRGSVSAAVLATSRWPQMTLRFARFLSSAEGGAEAFRKAGYTPVSGDRWEERPELVLHAGAMLRPAIEPTIQAFERREGCEVVRVYNGCGILVAQMQAGAKPDVYFACDRSFMEMVKDHFGDVSDISLNQLVILVKKGNPHAVRTLKDLGKPGLKLGVGHEKQCALGALTQETLRQGKVLEAVMKNVVVQAPAGDLLVNQLRAGGLDAVVAYVSNAAAAADELDAIAVDLPCALAVQPVAVSRTSTRARLAGRLVDALRTPESRARFESEGFRWKAP